MNHQRLPPLPPFGSPDGPRPGWGQWLAVVAFLGAVGLSLLWWSGRTEVQVENQSGQTLQLVRVSFPGQVCDFEQVPPGAQRTCSGRASQDGYLSVLVTMSTGDTRELGPDDNYVSATAGWRGVVAVKSGGGGGDGGSDGEGE